jgi:hypothetical protein
MRFAQQVLERRFPVFERPISQILAIEFEKIEGAKRNEVVLTSVSDQIEDGQAIVIANDCFAIDYRRSGWQRLDRYR